MSTVLKLTVAESDVHEIPFTRQSTLTVANAGSVIAYTDVTGIEIVDKTTGEVLDSIADDTPGFESVAGAIHAAKGMAVADAGAHIEKAIVKFGDDADLLQVQDDISAAVRSNSESWTTAVTVDADEEPEASRDTDLAAAIDAIHACDTVGEASEKIEAALNEWPDNAELVSLKQRADEILAAKTTDGDVPQPPAPLEEMNLVALRDYATMIGVDADTLATFEPANTPKADVRAAITARLETLAAKA